MRAAARKTGRWNAEDVLLERETGSPPSCALALEIKDLEKRCCSGIQRRRQNGGCVFACVWMRRVSVRESKGREMREEQQQQ